VLTGFSWFIFLFLSSFDVTFISSSTPVTILSLFPSTKSPPPPLPPMLGVQNSISPVSRLHFPHNSSSDIFQAPPSPKSFQSVSSPQVHHISFPSDLSQLNALYRIDSRNRPPRPPPSPKRLHLQRSKPVLTVRPPLRRFGVEMRRANLCATPVVSLTFLFIPFHVDVPLHNTHLTHVSDVFECTPSNACVARIDLLPFPISRQGRAFASHPSACSQSTIVHA
jgi:hypothetical protein